MRLDDCGAFEQSPEVRGRVTLALQRARVVDRGMEARAGALQRLERERAREVGRSREPRCPDESERRHRRHELGAVDQREPLLGEESRRLEPDRCEGVRPRQELPLDGRPALADERQRQVCQRCEISAGADRSARRDVRQEAAVEAFDQKLDGLDARA
jgi:hypothetical protein